MRIKLNVNGTMCELEVEPRTTLLDCLRDQLALTGAHAGCEHGVCGACTVLFDGVAVRSCLMFAAQAEGSAVTTIEGITPGPGELSPIQDAFCETHGMQCGYCTPAMTLARGHRRGDLRQYLPLHRLCADRGSDRACRRAHARRQ
jgi:carbon-monoxide dehydrogenase small subunit